MSINTVSFGYAIAPQVLQDALLLDILEYDYGELCYWVHRNGGDADEPYGPKEQQEAAALLIINEKRPSATKDQIDKTLDRLDCLRRRHTHDVATETRAIMDGEGK